MESIFYILYISSLYIFHIVLVRRTFHIIPSQGFVVGSNRPCSYCTAVPGSSDIFIQRRQSFNHCCPHSKIPQNASERNFSIQFHL